MPLLSSTNWRPDSMPSTSNPVSVFVLGLVERAAKSAAQSALAAYVGQDVNLVSGGWKVLGLAAASGFILSVLTSVASQPVGNTDTPSLVPVTTSPVSVEVKHPAPAVAPPQDALQRMDSIFPH